LSKDIKSLKEKKIASTNNLINSKEINFSRLSEKNTSAKSRKSYENGEITINILNDNKNCNNKNNNKAIIHDADFAEKIILIRKIILIQTTWRNKLGRKLKIHRFFNGLFKLFKIDFLIKKFIKKLRKLYYLKQLKIENFCFDIINKKFIFNKNLNDMASKKENYFYFSFDNKKKLDFSNKINKRKNSELLDYSFEDTNNDEIHNFRNNKDKKMNRRISDTTSFCFIPVKKENRKKIYDAEKIIFLQKIIKGFLVKKSFAKKQTLEHVSLYKTTILLEKISNNKDTKLPEAKNIKHTKIIRDPKIESKIRNYLDEPEMTKQSRLKEENEFYFDKPNFNVISYFTEIIKIQKNFREFIIRKKTLYLQKENILTVTKLSNSLVFYNKKSIHLSSLPSGLNIAKRRRASNVENKIFESPKVNSKQRASVKQKYYDLKKIIQIQSAIRGYLIYRRYICRRTSCGCTTCLVF
jgi:hypothetical protein